jgi:hypothetical protein
MKAAVLHEFGGIPRYALDSGIAAGSEIGPENTLKVETRVRTPLGLPAKAQVRRPVESAQSLNAVVRATHVPLPSLNHAGIVVLTIATLLACVVARRLNLAG